MIDRITSRKALPEEVLNQIIAKKPTAWPLFVEETDQERARIPGCCARKTAPMSSLPALTPLAIPSTLHDSLTGAA